jgi:hypothetical protein
MKSNLKGIKSIKCFRCEIAFFNNSLKQIYGETDSAFCTDEKAITPAKFVVDSNVFKTIIPIFGYSLLVTKNYITVF